MDATTVIKSIVDRNLAGWAELGLNKKSAPICPLMIDKPVPFSTNSWYWKPITSTVTSAQLTSFEIAIGYRLPEYYKVFLQHKHFYNLTIGTAYFFEHSADSWLKVLFENLHHGYPREDLIDKGFIPFAMHDYWALLCFDTNRNKECADYPIVVWNYEEPARHTDYCASFAELLPTLEIEAYGSCDF